MIENKKLKMSLSENGCVSNLMLKNDPFEMNWVIDSTYLKGAEYNELDKLFGSFCITVDGKKCSSMEVVPIIKEEQQKTEVIYDFSNVQIKLSYDLKTRKEDLKWCVRILNKMKKKISVTEFGIWISFAYVMFRDKNVLKNIHNSAAVFPSISKNYTKLSIVRRDGQSENLGMYQVKGGEVSIGTYCAYQNLFFENVSPSLDGMLFHKMFFAGGYPENCRNNDWIYKHYGFELEANADKSWEFVITANKSQNEFYEKGLLLNHPKIEYTPLNIIGEFVRGSIEIPLDKKIESIKAWYKEEGKIKQIAVETQPDNKERKYKFAFKPQVMGEHKIVFTFSDNTEDSVVLNVMDRIENVIRDRVGYICDKLYTGENGNPAYAFEPISNQGESLGKVNLVLKKNLLGELDVEQVRKVEKCVVNYVRNKWFIDGNFKNPRKLYGDFYRCMDFEYIAHLFYLLSEFDNSVLELNDADTYLVWAAEVFDLRVNPVLHKDERGKEEAQMLGVYFLYINELLEKLKRNGLLGVYNEIHALWEKVIDRVDKESDSYKAAITEHYYDNAGFGPTAGALAQCNKIESAKRYGKLLLANIGYSNDFRAQNPDRWWEALTYMIHSLWGGVTAASAYKVFELLKDIDYLDASYRATAGILYCYDTNATSVSQLEKGMAASTYAVAGPHINRPDLSRDRFGQSIFYRDGGIFAKLFENDSQTPDWDMGEELVAYLDNFGDKTFIIDKKDTIEVINGSFQEIDSEYIITSFAPYISKYYYISECAIIQLDSKDGQRQISIKKKK
ncbi:hypothetical protein D7V86_01300 [bacterium D16-51]|nr:hypothetical protein D7V96_04020 [bacterium D16-59]RKI62864.1 hypothetical protein D7V86_01300 [bacterium D16-51]